MDSDDIVIEKTIIKTKNKIENVIENLKKFQLDSDEDDDDVDGSGLKKEIQSIIDEDDNIENNVNDCNESDSRIKSSRKIRKRNRKVKNCKIENNSQSSSNILTVEIENTFYKEPAMYSVENMPVDMPQSSTERHVELEKKNEPFELSKEAYLIIKLLEMNSKDRERFLKIQAKERGIFKRDPITGIFNLDRKIYKKFLRKDRKSNFAYERQPITLEPSQNSETTSSKKKDKQNESQSKKSKKEKLTNFEDYVNALLYGRDFKTKENVLLLKNVNPNPDDHSFKTKENQENLENFIEKIIELKLGECIEGELRINAKNKNQSFVTASNGDIFIRSISLRQCGLQGDRVLAFFKYHEDDKGGDSDLEENDEEIIELNEGILEEDSLISIRKNKKGFVVKILETNHSKNCVGRFKENSKINKKIYEFESRDPKMSIIRFNFEDLPDSYKESLDDEEKFKEECKILYEISIINDSSDYLYGKIIKRIGEANVLENEYKGILLQYNLKPVTFPDDILETLPPIPYTITEDEISKRHDLRDQCIFTIDPITARDLDDALSCRILNNGNYEIGVHISDVSYFVKEFSPLDEIIKNHTTSIYMVDQVFHMLPEPLCLSCSLLPGNDSLTFSVFYEFTKNGEILNTKFERTVINSCCKLAYEHAQMVIDDPDKNFESSEFPQIHNGYKLDEIVEIIKNLYSISKILRVKRFENGAIKIDQPKIRFELDKETGKPLSYSVEDRKDSNFMIEEFMLLANQSVAAFIFENFSEISILRNHYPPDPRLLNELTAKLEGMNKKLDITNTKTIRESMDKIIKTSKYKTAMECLINQMIAKVMTRAMYFCSANIKSYDQCFHYALSVPIYTHFTSPIRRYPDILVHRLLGAALKLNEIPKRPLLEMNKIIANCNDQKYRSRLASDENTILYFHEFIKSNRSVTMKAAISYIGEFYLEVVLIEVRQTIKIFFRDLRPDLKAYLSKINDHSELVVISLIKKRKKRYFRVFDECTVKVFLKKEKLNAILAPSDLLGGEEELETNTNS